MAAKNVVCLAEIPGLTVMAKGGPLEAGCVTGAIEVYPVAIVWRKRGNQPTVVFLLRYRSGIRRMPAEAFRERLAASMDLLAAIQHPVRPHRGGQHPVRPEATGGGRGLRAGQPRLRVSSGRQRRHGR